MKQDTVIAWKSRQIDSSISDQKAAEKGKASDVPIVVSPQKVESQRENLVVSSKALATSLVPSVLSEAGSLAASRLHQQTSQPLDWKAFISTSSAVL